MEPKTREKDTDIILKRLVNDFNQLSKDIVVYYENEQWVLMEKSLNSIKLISTMIRNNLDKNERTVPETSKN